MYPVVHPSQQQGYTGDAQDVHQNLTQGYQGGATAVLQNQSQGVRPGFVNAGNGFQSQMEGDEGLLTHNQNNVELYFNRDDAASIQQASYEVPQGGQEGQGDPAPVEATQGDAQDNQTGSWIDQMEVDGW